MESIKQQIKYVLDSAIEKGTNILGSLFVGIWTNKQNQSFK